MTPINPPNDSAAAVSLRQLSRDDLPMLFAQQLDEEAQVMAAFTAPDPTDKVAFMAKWERLLSEPTIINRAILHDGRLAGHIAKFEQDGRAELTYWLGREFWGRGIATRALALFLTELQERPLFARAAADNTGSIRVLQKNGFTLIAQERGFANARNAEIDEVVMRLD